MEKVTSGEDTHAQEDDNSVAVSKAQSEEPGLPQQRQEHDCQSRPRKWALLVGVAPSEGAGTMDQILYNEALLGGAPNCRNVRALLISYGFADDDITTLTSVEDTTKQSIMQRFDEVTRGGYRPTDHFVFYISGHGGYQQFDLDAGTGAFLSDTPAPMGEAAAGTAFSMEFDEDNLDNSEEYARERSPCVCAYRDANVEPSDENCIPLQRLYGCGAPAHCHRTFIIDACFAANQVPKFDDVFAFNFGRTASYIHAPTSLKEVNLIVAAAPANAVGFGNREGSDLVTGLMSMCQGAKKICHRDLEESLRDHVIRTCPSEMYRSARAKCMTVQFSPEHKEAMFLLYPADEVTGLKVLSL